MTVLSGDVISWCLESAMIQGLHAIPRKHKTLGKSTAEKPNPAAGGRAVGRSSVRKDCARDFSTTEDNTWASLAHPQAILAHQVFVALFSACSFFTREPSAHGL